MNYQQMIAYICDIPKFTKKNSRNHTRCFLELLNNPEENLKVIHVAGTNGKGSVCSYIESILLGQGKRVGMFTSPHLEIMNERIRIQGISISDDVFLDAFHHVKKACDLLEEEGKQHPTFFEFLFGISLVVFEKSKVEYVVLETGLGGRLDATNTIEKPLVTVITSIGLDHQAYLGNTIEEIAKEKAGIIKKEVPLIYDATHPSVRMVMEDTCKMNQTKGIGITKDSYRINEVTEKKIDFSLVDAYDKSSVYSIKNKGKYQVLNACLAIEAAKIILDQEKQDGIQWAEYLYRTNWPGRMESIGQGVVVDGAHNVPAIEAFAKEVVEADSILFSTVADKDYEKMIEILCREVSCNRFIVTTIQEERGVSAKELEKVFLLYTNCPVYREDSVELAWDRLLKQQKENKISYCLGSMYLVGMIKGMVTKDQ